MDYAILLAAGDGVRMKSKKHKVLHEVCGRPIIGHGVQLMHEAGIEKPIVIIGQKGGDQIREYLGDSAQYVQQDMSKGYGTGIAVRAAEHLLKDANGIVFVMVGDAPLFEASSALELRKKVEEGVDCAALTTIAGNPTGYGRVIRDGQYMVDVVEEAELSDEQRAIKEVNVSLYCLRVKTLLDALSKLQLHTPKNEYYLTDIVPIITKAGGKVVPVLCEEECSLGVNDRVQLALCQGILQRRILEKHMRAGVTIINPENTCIDVDVEIGADTVIYPGCVLQGRTKIGEDCTLMQGCRVKDTMVENGVQIESSTLVNAHVGSGTTIGPNAYLRPGANVGKNCRIGDFVEIKEANIGDGTKISHLTYVGDADLGKNINLGCGVVFTNYDGKTKHRSTVHDNAFIGCNANLIAPVTIGQGAYIAAGSTITEDVEDGALAVARERQRNIPGWVEKRKSKGLL